MTLTTVSGAMRKHGRGPHGSVRSETCEGTGQQPRAIVRQPCSDETAGSVGPRGQRILMVEVAPDDPRAKRPKDGT
jgi:hypothetical protein